MEKIQLFYEDVKKGMKLPEITYGPITTEMIVRFACASNNFHPIHYDKDIARAEGHSDVLVHGPLRLALFERLVLNWIGELGIIKTINALYTGIDLPGDTLNVSGKVLAKFLEKDKGNVQCDLWSKNQRGEITTKGFAFIILPVRFK